MNTYLKHVHLILSPSVLSHYKKSSSASAKSITDRSQNYILRPNCNRIRWSIILGCEPKFTIGNPVQNRSLSLLRGSVLIYYDHIAISLLHIKNCDRFFDHKLIASKKGTKNCDRLLSSNIN